MRRLSMGFALVAAMTAMGATGARAADMSYSPIVEPAPMVEDVEMGSNWYLRGDIGYVFSNDVDVDASWAAAGANFANDDIEESFSFGGGVGFKAGWLRADLTVDQISPSEITATRTVAVCDVALSGGDACTTTERGEIGFVPMLANVYFDLGTWSGLTPYVGVGLGASFVWADSWRTVVDPNTVGAVTITNQTEESFSFTYALMAGMSYSVTDNLAVDLGYRYLSVADGDLVNPYIPNGTAPAGFPTTATLERKDLITQEVRLGIRYLID
ncbi:MAG: outer membrane protein [Labrys sp. (in: a-proteobacteria)]